MAVAVLVGLVAHVYPKPFPHDRNVLLVCVIVFFALQAVMQLINTFVERDFIYLSRPCEVSFLVSGDVNPHERTERNKGTIGESAAKCRMITPRYAYDLSAFGLRNV